MGNDFSERLDAGPSDDSESKRVARFGRLKHYTILGLFGFYNHSFHLDSFEPTMLTGANGTGKSTVLRTIRWVSQGDWGSLAKTPFERIILEFDEAQVVVNRKSTEGFRIQLSREGLNPKVWDYNLLDEARGGTDFKRFVSRYADAELDPDVWEEFSLRERQQLFTLWQTKQEASVPAWVASMARSFPVLLVSDQRLAPARRERPKSRGVGNVVDVVAAIEAAVLHINEEVQRYKSLYGTASQNLDQNFPRRVFTAINSQRRFGGRRDIEREFQELQDLRSSLAAAGLIDAAEVEESIADLPLDNPDSLALISTYLDDTKKKLATFEPLRRRLEPFIDFLRRHYKGKRIRIDEQHGFRIASDRTGEDILPVHLSSGEQQIFILAHKLLFESSPGTLVLIDEPELSLHVLWQSSFVDDLTEISEVSGAYFLLATHSPTLIAGRTDLRRSLDG